MTPPKINILYDSRQFSIIQDEIDLIWLYSGGVPVAYYDKEKGKIFKDRTRELTGREFSHLGVFKKKIKEIQF